MGLAFLEKRKFIIMVGDDGAVLVFVNGDKVEKRLFATSPALNDRREFNSLLLQFPTVPVYVMLDTMEQSYTKQTLPAVSSLAVGKLVNKRLERDFAKTDIKGALLLGRDEEGRRDWIYLFASAPLTATLSEWIDYISSLENKFTGIYMLPVEMESFVSNLNKKFLKAKETVPDWQFLVTNNKTGGFRQVIIHKGKVIFTRLIRPSKDTIADIIAGNIEQEILNTVDYMRRLGFSDEDSIAIFAVLPKDIKRSLQDTKINGKDLNIYTPYEAAEMLNIKGVVTEDDKYCDVVIATNFTKSKHILKLDDPKMRTINSLLMVGSASTAVAFLVVPTMMLYSAYTGYNILSISGNIKNLENDKAGIEKKWKDARKSGEYNIDDANKITDVVTLHKELSDVLNPLKLVARVSVPQVDVALTRSFTWNYIEKQGGNNQTPSQIKGEEDAIFNLEFTNMGDSIEDLLDNFDAFAKSVKGGLAGYEVEMSELPNTITFDNNKKSIAVQIKVKTKDENI